MLQPQMIEPEFDQLFKFKGIRTYTGKFVDLLNPTEDMIDVEDIAHALSEEGRWGNHTKVKYSVGQHSMVVCDSVEEEEEKLAALFHDSTEAYLKDIMKPLKDLLPEYQKIEERFAIVIAKKFGYTYPYHPNIKTWDNYWLKAEWATFMVQDRTSPYYKKFMTAMPAHDVKETFLHMYKELTAKKQANVR